MRASGRMAESTGIRSTDQRDLRVRLLEGASGDDVFRLRCDAVEAAKALDLLAQLEPGPTAPATTAGRSAIRTAALAGVAGLVAGLLLALLLAHTVFAPTFNCHSYGEHGFACTRTAR